MSQIGLFCLSGGSMDHTHISASHFDAFFCATLALMFGAVALRTGIHSAFFSPGSAQGRRKKTVFFCLNVQLGTPEKRDRLFVDVFPCQGESFVLFVVFVGVVPEYAEFPADPFGLLRGGFLHQVEAHSQQGHPEDQVERAEGQFLLAVVAEGAGGAHARHEIAESDCGQRNETRQ